MSLNNDLISRSALLEEFRARKMTDAVPDYDRATVDVKDALYQFAQLTKGLLFAAPAVDAEVVRHGRWEWYEEWSLSTPDHYAECDDCGWRCSECKNALEDMVGGYWDDPYEKPKLNFCTNCGAKMDGGADGD